MSDSLELAGAASLAALLHLEQRAQNATSPVELGFTVVNEVFTLLDYRQAAFFTCNVNGRLKLCAASGLVSVAEDSPYAVWLGRFVQSMERQSGCQKLDFPNTSPDLVEGWEEWLPAHLLVLHSLILRVNKLVWCCMRVIRFGRMLSSTCSIVRTRPMAIALMHSIVGLGRG